MTCIHTSTINFRKHIGRPPEVVPSGHAYSEISKRSSRELIRVSDPKGNTSTALSNRTADRPSIREDSSDYMRTRPHFSTFVRKITLIIDISSIPFL